MDDTSATGIIKSGTRGRNRYTAEFKRQVLDAFEHRGPGGMQFAEQCGVKDPSFASRVRLRRGEGAGPDPGERKGPAKQQFLLAGIRRQDCLLIDETPIDYLCPGNGKTKRGCLWTYYHPEVGVIYDWRPSRSHQSLSEVLVDASTGVCYAGVADGAHDQWDWLERHTEWSILDFWHASEYLNRAAGAFARSQDKQQVWAQDACHRLKHDPGAVSEILVELQAAQERGVPKAVAEEVARTITYLENQKERMDYHLYRLIGLPIGSGVTEAACKCIAKARLCGSGMRWQLEGAQDVLSLRSLIKSSGRWEQFWRKTAQHGFSKITRPVRPSSRRTT